MANKELRSETLEKIKKEQTNLIQEMERQQQELDQKHQELDQKQQELDQKQQELYQKQQELYQKRRGLYQKQQELDQLHQELDQRQRELDQKHQELDQRQQELDQTQEMLQKQELESERQLEMQSDRASVVLDYSKLAEIHLNSEDEKLTSDNSDDRRKELFEDYQHIADEYIDNQDSNGEDNLYSAEVTVGYYSSTLLATAAGIIALTATPFLTTIYIHDPHFKFSLS